MAGRRSVPGVALRIAMMGDGRRSDWRAARLPVASGPKGPASVSGWIGRSVGVQPPCGQAPSAAKRFAGHRRRAALRVPVLLSTVVRTIPVTLRPWSHPEVRRRGERWRQDVAPGTSRTRRSSTSGPRGVRRRSGRVHPGVQRGDDGSAPGVCGQPCWVELGALGRALDDLGDRLPIDEPAHRVREHRRDRLALVSVARAMRSRAPVVRPPAALDGRTVCDSDRSEVM